MTLNYETKGSEVASIAGNTTRSTVDVVVNEDWAMTMEVYLVSAGVVTGVKVWDEDVGSKTQFQAQLQYIGKDGTPPNNAVEVGQKVVFYRIPTGWVCFVPYIPVIFVRDNGNNTATEVQWTGGTFAVPAGSETLTMRQTDPAIFYHESLPPFQSGRIYAAQKINNTYIVFLPGHGTTAKLFTESTSQYIFELKVDGQGNVLEFDVQEVTP